MVFGVILPRFHIDIVDLVEITILIWNNGLRQYYSAFQMAWNHQKSVPWLILSFFITWEYIKTEQLEFFGLLDAKTSLICQIDCWIFDSKSAILMSNQLVFTVKPWKMPTSISVIPHFDWHSDCLDFILPKDTLPQSDFSWSFWPDTTFWCGKCHKYSKTSRNRFYVSWSIFFDLFTWF